MNKNVRAISLAVLLGFLGGLAYWLSKPGARPPMESESELNTPRLPGLLSEQEAWGRHLTPPELPVEPGDSTREELIQQRIRFISSDAGQVVRPEMAYRLWADGVIESLDTLGDVISVSSRTSEPLVVLATFPWHLAQVVALPKGNKITEIQVEVQRCGKVVVNIRGEGGVNLQTTDKLVIEPHRGALGEENREGSRYHYFLANEASSAWYYLPYDVEDLQAAPILSQIFNSAIQGLDNAEIASQGFFTHPCLRFESDRTLAVGPTQLGLLPEGGPYRWSSNRHLQFDPEADSMAILARERALGPKELPFPAGTLNDGWFRVQGGVENTVSLILSEGCSIRGGLPPNDVYETTIPRVTLYRIERPGLGGNTQNSATEVLRCTPKGSGAFAFLDITPGEYRICASWPMKDEVHIFSQLLSLAPGEERDLGLLSPQEGSELILDAHMRDESGLRIDDAAGEPSLPLLPVQILNHEFEDPLANFADYVRVRLGQKVVIRGLPQGTWTVLVPKLVELDKYIPSPIVLQAWPEPITFELGEQALVEFPIDVMRELQHVEVTIQPPSSLPSSNFMWNLAPAQSQGNLRSERINLRPGNEASIHLDLPAGKYHLFLTERGAMTQTKHDGWYGWCHFEVTDSPIREVATLAQGITIKGKVVVSAERPLKGLAVSFDLLSFLGNEESTRDQYRAFCDAEGNFVINGMPEQATLISRNSGERVTIEPGLEEIIIHP